jgi:transposase
MGRSRGGLTTKIHALVDADGLPIRLELTAGQAADAPMAEKLLSDLQPGTTILADMAYDTDAIRNFAKQRKCWANIPQRPPEKRPSASAAGSTVNAISWSASSIASSRCAAWPPDTTDAPTTTLQPSSLQQ